jgi:hypothetical protein
VGFVRGVMLIVLLLLAGAAMLVAADGLRFTAERSSASSGSSMAPAGALSTPTPPTAARTAGATHTVVGP